jgi:hypothetical protein
MGHFKADELANRASKLDERSKLPLPGDHPKWLKRRAKVYRKWAAQKEKALEHKKHQENRKRP